jgi:hypothetical protein
VLRLNPSAARSKVVALAKRWGLSWVVAAIDRAEAKAAAEPLRNPSGYVVRALEGFQAEGGPPAPPDGVAAGGRETAGDLMDGIRRREEEVAAFLASIGEGPSHDAPAEPSPEAEPPGTTDVEIRAFVMEALADEPDGRLADELVDEWLRATFPAGAPYRVKEDAKRRFWRVCDALVDAKTLRRRSNKPHRFIPPFTFSLASETAGVPAERWIG